MWVKKCVEIREILFKNWKLLFEYTNQTPPSDLIATFQIMLWNCKLKTQCSLFSRLEHIFKDASCLLNGLRWVELKCVKRSANLVAHSLARYAREVSNEVIWLEDSPPLAMEAFYLNSISIQWMKVWILFHKEKK